MRYTCPTVLFSGRDAEDAKAYMRRFGLSTEDVKITQGAETGQVNVKIREGKHVELRERNEHTTEVQAGGSQVRSATVS